MWRNSWCHHQLIHFVYSESLMILLLCLDPFAWHFWFICSKRPLNYLTFQSFDWEYLMKVITRTCRVHTIRYLYFYSIATLTKACKGRFHTVKQLIVTNMLGRTKTHVSCLFFLQGNTLKYPDKILCILKLHQTIYFLCLVLYNTQFSCLMTVISFHRGASWYRNVLQNSLPRIYIKLNFFF